VRLGPRVGLHLGLLLPRDWLRGKLHYYIRIL
jgi:hypothetical protein